MTKNENNCDSNVCNPNFYIMEMFLYYVQFLPH